MCRNIRTLHNFEPPATEEEIHAAALQYVRKISGSTKPSQANAEAFDARGRGGRRGHRAQLLDRAGDRGAAEGPRGRGGEAPRSERAALRRLSRRDSLYAAAGTATPSSSAAIRVPSTRLAIFWNATSRA